ncbi:unnamed protein product [Prorocentrum cordatum]|uniref:Uncharacterized protein n=1 Tax=Prorocentrum cordatum TaxID=2364126 RepID=A0ABN9VCE0_9DINO|nr:unnamed protein product [Polarella glacialis]
MLLLRGVCRASARSSCAARRQWRPPAPASARCGGGGRRTGSSLHELDLWSDHADLEHTQEYFALAQENVMGQLVEALHKRGLVSKTSSVVQAAPAEERRRRELDPHRLFMSWTTGEPGAKPLPATDVELTLLQAASPVRRGSRGGFRTSSTGACQGLVFAASIIFDDLGFGGIRLHSNAGKYAAIFWFRGKYPASEETASIPRRSQTPLRADEAEIFGFAAARAQGGCLEGCRPEPGRRVESGVNGKQVRDATLATGQRRGQGGGPRQSPPDGT